MTMSNHLGFRIVGAVTGERRVVNAAVAFEAYLACDNNAQVDQEAYLSAFWFDQSFESHMRRQNSVANFQGSTWGPWLWFDFDRAELELARRDAARLALTITDRYKIDEDQLLIFFSGSKGFHIGIPTSLWQPDPDVNFHLFARRFAEQLAGQAHVQIDTSVYDRVRAFRAPNSRHARSGLHKRSLSLDMLQEFGTQRILELAQAPAPVELPDLPPVNEQAVTDWQAAINSVQAAQLARASRRSNQSSPRLNRATLAFIRGEDFPERNVALFSAAANLAEFGASLPLVEALLTEPALDLGLTPSEVNRTILNGHRHSFSSSSSQ
jgi:hypothetical protein